MKRKIAFLLIITILASLFQIVSSAVHYTDVSSNYAYFDSVNYVSDNSLMSAVSGNSFGVSTNMTRAMVLIVLYRYEGSPNKFSPNPFSDVSSSDGYYNAVRWAVYANITSGTSGSTFSPNQNITRQDLACFLYRYARYKDYDLEHNVLNLSELYDRNSISNYAHDSVCWAVGKNIIPCDSSHIFSPASYMTRGYFADVMVKFGSNSKGIDLYKEAFSFSNSYANFFPELPSGVTACYEMTSSISNYLYASVGSVYGNAVKVKIIEEHNKAWQGACFGMSIICALDKIGKIDFDGNFSTASNICSMYRPLNDTNIKNYIHYYQLLQFITPISTNHKTEPSVAKLNDLISRLKNRGVLIFSFSIPKTDSSGNVTEEGHSTLLYDYCVEGGAFIFDVYDPNYPRQKVQIVMADYGREVYYCNPYRSVAVSKYRIIDDFDCFDDFDIDGTYNNSPMYYSSNQSISNTENAYMPWTNEDVAMLTVPINYDWVITNSNGDTIINNGGTLSGTMNIIGYDFTVGVNPMYRILVDKSESYTVVSEKNNIDISILEKYKYIGVEAKNAESVNIDGDYINMKGNNIDFDSCVYIEECSSETFRLTGNSDDMKLSIKDNSINIEADRYSCDIQAYSGTDITSEENVYCYSLSSAQNLCK